MSLRTVRTRNGKDARDGVCRICGFAGRLSFEHVPPKAAFNNRPLVVAGMADLLGQDLDQRRGRTQQRGSGEYTLCEKCNNQTGHWYGDAYVEWARQALMIIRATRGAASLHYGYWLHPLRVLKQILCMFFSVNGPEFAGRHPELVRSVMDHERRGLPPDVQIFAFLTASDRGRGCGVSAMGRFDRGDAIILSEVTFPPLGFILCLGSPAPDPRLVDITFFANYGYREVRDLYLRLPVLPVYTQYPGDFRPREKVLEQLARSQAALASGNT